MRGRSLSHRWWVLLLLTGALAAGCDSSGSSSDAPETPRAPSNLEARADGETIVLEWSPSSRNSNSEPVRYNVYRATDSIQSPSGREPLNDAPLEEPSFTDPGATPWQPYRYGVTAVRGSGEQAAESGLSGQVQYTLPQVEYVLEAPDPQGPSQFGVPIGFGGPVAGGADPVEYLSAYPDHFQLLHIKDMTEEVRFSGDGETPSQWAELFPYMADPGSGVLDLPAIIKQARSAGVQHYYLERDQAPDEEKTLKTGYRYLSSLQVEN